MTSNRNFLFTFGLIALGAGGIPSSAHAHTAAVEQCSVLKDPQTQEECACKAALDDGSIEALEEFLNSYGTEGETACTALARKRLSDLARPDNDNDRERPFNPGY
jgi:hypothetical protein